MTDSPQLARILLPFIGVVIFPAFIIMFFRYWKQYLINREELIRAKNIHKIVRNQEVGDAGRYNFGQKCVFWAAIISLLLLLASGIDIWRPYFADAFVIPLIRLALMVHSLSAVVLIIAIMVHIYAALWMKGTLTAMVEVGSLPPGRNTIIHAGIVRYVHCRNARNNRKNAPNEYSHNPARSVGEKR